MPGLGERGLSGCVCFGYQDLDITASFFFVFRVVCAVLNGDSWLGTYLDRGATDRTLGIGDVWEDKTRWEACFWFKMLLFFYF